MHSSGPTNTRAAVEPADRLVPVRKLMALLLACMLLVGCGAPYLSPDGLLVFPEPGDTGAMVITPNGVMFQDRAHPPTRISYRSPYEPWRNPAGFIAPADGVFTHTSRATILIANGLMVSVRPSDELAPTWGGDLMLRIDVTAPSTAARTGLDAALIVDGEGPDTLGLVGVVLGQLGSDDRVMVVEARGAHVVVPWLPAAHRSLALAAIERRLARPAHSRGPNLYGALEAAWSGSGPNRLRKVIVLTDGSSAGLLQGGAPATPAGQSAPLVVSSSIEARMDSLQRIGELLGAAVSVDSDWALRADAVRAYVPVMGPVAYRNLALRFDGVPGPSHLLEASGGTVLWDLQADQLVLGDVRAGESRTEVARLTMPGWPATLSFQMRLLVQFEPEGAAGPVRVQAEMQLPYDEDIVRIAQWRCGDVLAYASALAWMNRLRQAFVGEGIDRAGGLYRVARLHQASMQSLAKDRGDRAALQQALVLSALLDANPP